MIKLIKLWILVSAACVAAGWILSALHQLNLAGYAVCFSVLAVAFAMAHLRGQRQNSAGCSVVGVDWVQRNLHRFRRPLPLLYFLTAAFAFVGGVVHPPNNYDALTYRFPRVLHWWAESGWHWIATPNERMNLSGTVFEWLMLPMYAVTHSDRLFFLINAAAYLLLPSLVFLVFIACGVGRRAAWFWMWLLPAALCYAMQAGSISNDTIAATYFLCALLFAFRARRSGEVSDLWLAVLAGGLLTGVKGSNLPLALPVAWAIWPVLNLVKKQFTGSVAVALLGLLVSFAPTAFMNARFTGDWTGDPNNIEKIKVKPLAGILGNGLQLGLQSLEPPFLPLARTAEMWVWNRFPEGLRTVLKSDFPRFVVGFRELPQEESAGVGIGITLIAIVSIVAAWRFRRMHQTRPADPVRRQGMMIGLLTWVALLAYMTKLGSESTCRLIAAYYPLVLLPMLVSPAQNFLVRNRWYQTLAVCTGLTALIAVILTPSRPLWPAKQFFDWATDRFPNSALMAHAKTIYAVYRSRNDQFAELRASIPKSVSVIGLIEDGDDAETSLWRPFGTRRVVHVLGADRILESKVQWLVVKDRLCGLKDAGEFNEWVRRIGGTLIAQRIITEKAGGGPEQWSVINFPGGSK